MSSVSNDSILLSFPVQKNTSCSSKFLKVSGIALSIILIVGAILAHFGGINTAIVFTLCLGGSVIFIASLAFIIKECKSQNKRLQSSVTVNLSRDTSSEKEENFKKLIDDYHDYAKCYDDYVKRMDAEEKGIPIQNYEEFCAARNDTLRSDGGEDVQIVQESENSQSSDSEEDEEFVEESPIVLYDPRQAEINKSITFKVKTNSEGIPHHIKKEIDQAILDSTKAKSEFESLCALLNDVTKGNPLNKLIQKYKDQPKILRYIFNEIKNRPNLLEPILKDKLFYGVDEDGVEEQSSAYYLLYGLELSEDEYIAHVEYFFNLGFIPDNSEFVEYLIDRMFDMVPIKKEVSSDYLPIKLISYLFHSALTPETKRNEDFQDNIVLLLIKALKKIPKNKPLNEVIDIIIDGIIRQASLTFEENYNVSKDSVENIFELIFDVISTAEIPINQKVKSQFSAAFLDEMQQTEKGLFQGKSLKGWFFQPIFIIKHELWLQTVDFEESFKQLIHSLSPKSIPFILSHYLPQGYLEKALDILGRQEYLKGENLTEDKIELFQEIAALLGSEDAKYYFPGMN